MARWTIADIGTLDEVAFIADLPRSTGSFALMLWLYATRSDQRQVVAKLGEPHGDGWSLALEDRRLWVEIEVAGQSCIIGAADIETAVWQAVVLLVDRGQELATLMIDGTLKDRRWFPNDVPHSFERLIIGGYSDPDGNDDYSFGRGQSGSVDEVQFYDFLPPAEMITAFCSRAQDDR